jgi:hypothetical protein
MDLPKILSDLAIRRPVFHSEADFQHELAWEIHSKYAGQGVQLRLEYPLAKVGTIDIWVLMDGRTYAIELKYKKERFHGDVGGEPFSFNTDKAHPLSRYDGFLDMVRVERACTLGANCGYALFLTNDSLYWRREATKGSRSFSLHDGREITPGILSWPKTALKFIKARPAPIQIQRKTRLEWHPYSQISSLETEFRYLVHHFEP